MFCEKDHKNWDENLPQFSLAINSAKQESTAFSPAFLNFGRELRLPNSLISSVVPTPEEEEDPAELAAHVKRINRLKEVFQLVRVNIGRAFSEQSRYYNRHHREWHCKVGEQVMKREHHLSSGVRGFAAKLAPKYSGPHEVIRVISPVVYDLKAKRGRVVKRIHIRDLKPFRNPVNQ